MKNYDAYLWASYGIGLGLMAWLVISAWWSHRQAVKRLQQDWQEAQQ